MKKISLILAGALIGSLAFAKGPGKPKPAASSMVITNPVGSSLFKLRYTAERVQKHVRVTLLDEKGRLVYAETINKTGGFIRPYNFKDLPEGNYAIKVEDENGMTLEKIEFNPSEIKNTTEKYVHISKLPVEPDKYVLMISSQQKDNITINIFDKENNLVYSEEADVNGGFGKVYSLKGINTFSIEVSDSNNLVKSVKF